jgi:hypothetical protein
MRKEWIKDKDVKKSEYGGICEYKKWDGKNKVLNKVKG